MSQLVWDNTGEREYETGCRKGVLYPIQTAANSTGSRYTKGVAWNGLTGVTESPSGAEPTDLYADDSKYLTLRSAEKLDATITAYMYPDAFGECDGSISPVKGMHIYQQSRKTFGMVYQTAIGNDTEGYDHGYKLHLLYGCSVSPSERAYKTVNENPEANELSWSVSTTPVPVKIDGTDYKPTSLITVDSTDYTDETTKGYLKKLEDILFGTSSTEPYLPMPEEVAAILKTGAYTVG